MIFDECCQKGRSAGFWKRAAKLGKSGDKKEDY